MRLSIGPILYFWPRESIEQFYQQIIASPLEVIYVGETVCNKRRSFKSAEWIELARQLALSGSWQDFVPQNVAGDCAMT